MGRGGPFEAFHRVSLRNGMRQVGSPGCSAKTWKNLFENSPEWALINLKSTGVVGSPSCEDTRGLLSQAGWAAASDAGSGSSIELSRVVQNKSETP